MYTKCMGRTRVVKIRRSKCPVVGSMFPHPSGNTSEVAAFGGFCGPRKLVAKML